MRNDRFDNFNSERDIPCAGSGRPSTRRCSMTAAEFRKIVA
jgi:hypothetical protein